MIREFLAVAARAALQWALSSLLLANGAAFCLIAAAAARLRLGPPCVLCARVHRLLCSASSAGGERDALRGLLCDAHLAAVGACPAPGRGDEGGVAERKGEGLEVDGSDKVSDEETHRVVSIGSEICEQDNGSERPLATDRSDVARTSTIADGDGQFVSLFELAPVAGHPRGGDESVDPATTPELVTVDGDERLTVGQVVSALRAQRRELEALRAELDGERRARAEAEEYQRQLEEQGELDREAARLAMQLVHESETEKHGLQRQLDACRVKAQLYDGGQDAGGEGGSRAASGAGDGNNYQSLVDFLPGTVYSSSPDLANLLKLYTEAGNGGGVRQREGYRTTAVAVVTEEVEEEEEEEEEVAVMVSTGDGSSEGVGATAIVGDSIDERSTNSCHLETETEMMGEETGKVK
ncbi:hypothetical protein ACP4OV_020121 [Aristida adscensionis]